MWAWTKLDVSGCLRSRLTHAEICTLALMAQYSNDDQVCTVPYSRLADRLHITRRSAIRHCHRLAANGFVAHLGVRPRTGLASFALLRCVAIGDQEPAPPRDPQKADRTQAEEHAEPAV